MVLQIFRAIAANLFHDLFQLGFQYGNGMITAAFAQRRHPVHKRAAQKGKPGA
jgi:hypothetical protein